MKHLHTYIIIIVVLLIAGCATGPTPLKRFVSPSQVLYDQAGAYFEDKDYDNAIITYEKFLEDNPRHDLAPGANLNIAWSHYLKSDYEKALNAQKKVKTKDETLKAWLAKLADNCKTKLAGTFDESSAPRLFDIPGFTNEGILKIEGIIPKDSKISINEIPTPAKDGLFSQEIPLEEGENSIIIITTDKNGNKETKKAKITLDTVIPEIKVTDAEIDDLDYVTISGITENLSTVIINGEEFLASAKGNFVGEVKLARNQKFEIISEDRAGNTAKMIFSDTDYPDPPYGLSLTDTYGDSADITWNENSEEDIKGYNVYYSLDGDFSDQIHNTELIEETRYTLGSLRSGNTYTIYVRAVDKMGNESNRSRETLTAVIP